MRTRITVIVDKTPVLVQSTSSDTRKKIAKRNKRMLKRRNHKDIRKFNADGLNRRSFVYIGSFD